MKLPMYMRLLILPVVVCLLQYCPAGAQQNAARDVIVRAMRDELNRNLEGLRLENMERPFFIGYTINDVTTVEIIASLGAIVSSDETRNRDASVRVMAGDYALNDENFMDYSFKNRSTMLGESGMLPLDNDYAGIRRALWVATDNVYKNAAELFEHKKAAIKQQIMSDKDAQLEDFSRAPTVKYSELPRSFGIDRAGWERAARDLSGIFQACPDIFASRVRLFFYRGDTYVVNSEGTEVIQPLTLASVQIDAWTQAAGGEPISNHDSFFGIVPGDLPSLGTMKQAAQHVADQLTELRSAPVFDDSYFGPVMLEDQAVAEFFSQRLFSGNNGLLAYRSPIVSNTGAGYDSRDEETLDDRIERRILSRDLTITAMPSLKRFMNINLLGSYEVDAEGVKPPAETVLVNNGILKTLLNNRIPTRKVQSSNGHERPLLTGYSASSAIGPSVISIVSSNGQSKGDVKRELISRARDEGLEYGILVRKLQPMSVGSGPLFWMGLNSGKRGSSSLTRPLLVYRVYVDDGREEPIRSILLGDVSLSALRHIAAASREQYVYNTLATAGWRSGIPSSFIVPGAIVLEELEVKNEKRSYTPKLPVVSSPLARR